MPITGPEAGREHAIKVSELERWKKEWADKGDRVGTPIDEDIAETVALFNAMGLRTQQSCEGHFGTDEEGQPTPWIFVEPKQPKPSIEDQTPKQREWVNREYQKMRNKTFSLLSEFYKDRHVPFDVQLGFRNVEDGFKIQSNGLESFEAFADFEKKSKAVQYKQEMQAFTDFLRQKYFTS